MKMGICGVSSGSYNYGNSNPELKEEFKKI